MGNYMLELHLRSIIAFVLELGVHSMKIWSRCTSTADHLETTDLASPINNRTYRPELGVFCTDK
jgi:hypothetical protein